jgi:hypothetical protein
MIQPNQVSLRRINEGIAYKAGEKMQVIFQGYFRLVMEGVISAQVLRKKEWLLGSGDWEAVWKKVSNGAMTVSLRDSGEPWLRVQGNQYLSLTLLSSALTAIL